MKTAAAAFLLLTAIPAFACDWVSDESVSPMTDVKSCHIWSGEAKLSLFVYPDHIVFGTGSAYRGGRDSLRVRIDDNKPIILGRNRSTYSHFPPDSEGARLAIEQIQTGERIRVSFSDYPSHQKGDAPICNLPELIRSCQAGG